MGLGRVLLCLHLLRDKEHNLIVMSHMVTVPALTSGQVPLQAYKALECARWTTVTILRVCCMRLMAINICRFPRSNAKTKGIGCQWRVSNGCQTVVAHPMVVSGCILSKPLQGVAQLRRRPSPALADARSTPLPKSTRVWHSSDAGLPRAA